MNLPGPSRCPVAGLPLPMSDRPGPSAALEWPFLAGRMAALDVGETPRQRSGPAVPVETLEDSRAGEVDATSVGVARANEGIGVLPAGVPAGALLGYVVLGMGSAGTTLLLSPRACPRRGAWARSMQAG